ncbi:protein kinase [Massilia sp. H-1]|nr:protein kinase [Massilia sp. H-1]
MEQEQARRNLEVDKDRRHQLDLLNLQNDVNKAALKSQAELGAGVAQAGAQVRYHQAPSRLPEWPSGRTERSFLRPLRRGDSNLTGPMQTARDKIRELRALHEDGLLSQQEFDSRKNAILDAEYAPPGRMPTPMLRPRSTSSRAPRSASWLSQEIGPQNRRYRLERLIAHGGMGQVWQATDLATHAELGHSAMVALKILPPMLTQSPSHAKLLIEEATQARRLAHEHIVRVYEWAQDPATASYFIIMECLEGEDLDSLLARRSAHA